MERQPRLLREITNCENIIGLPEADAKIKQNNKINKLNRYDVNYIPLSYEKDLCLQFLNNLKIYNIRK